MENKEIKKPNKKDYGYITYQYCGYEYGFFPDNESEKDYKKALKEFYDSKS